MTPVSRRTALALGTAAAAATLFRPHLARAAAPFEQPPLPYAEDALAPEISARTVALHYGKHHKAYYTKLNELVPNTPFADMSLEQVVVEAKKQNENAIFNQAGQAWNHVFYWDQFKGFGTGWVWLVSDGSKLSIKGYQDAGNPLPEGLKPIVGVDVWEHAYYLDYENRRPEHVKAVLTGRVNWAAAGERMA